MIGGEKTTSPAYSVTVESTGQVTVSIVRFEDAEGLERELAKVSVSADVHYLSRHQTCRRTPAGVPLFENARKGPRMPLIKSDGSGTMTVDPAKLKGATLTIEASFEDGLTATPSPGLLTGSLSINVLKNGTFGPCVVVVGR